MSATQLMADLTSLGIQLEAHGDRLRYSPRSAVTPELARRMKTHKGELLAMLRRNPPADETADQLLDDLAHRGCLLGLDKAKAHKAEMSAILRGDLPPDGCSHHDRACWLDAPADDRSGWIRTTCRWCGRFIGYRPVGIK